MSGSSSAASGRRETRLERARAAMRATELDALLLFSGPNLTYLAGSSVTELTAGRAWYLLLPATGEPTLIVHAWRELQAREETWIEDVRGYPRLSRVPLAQLESVLRGRRTVGVELAGEMRLGIPEADFEELRRHFDSTSFEDASSLLWSLRLVKDEGEVDSVRRACSFTAAAYRRTFATLRAGTPAGEAVWRMKSAMLQLGGAAPWVLASIGRGHYAYGTEVVDDRPLEPGDMVWFDAGCAVRGYWSDYSRAAVIGPPAPAQRELHEAVHDATSTGVRLIRPGRAAAEIAQACNEAMRKLTGPGTIPLSTLAGRIGHGLGLDLTELPHLAEHDETILEPGMIVTVEPGIATADGTFHVEENVLVTAGGHEVLSTAPWPLTQA